MSGQWNTDQIVPLINTVLCTPSNLARLHLAGR